MRPAAQASGMKTSGAVVTITESVDSPLVISASRDVQTNALTFRAPLPPGTPAR